MRTSASVFLLRVLPFVVFLQLLIGIATSFQNTQYHHEHPAIKRIASASLSLSLSSLSFHRQETSLNLSSSSAAAGRVDRQTAWNEKYQQLVKFREKHGHTRVKYDDSSGKSVTLYRWMANQRCKRRNNNKNNNNNVKSKGNHAPLSEEQIRLLDKIDFQWTPREDLLETEWNANYQKLIANFYNKHKAPLELNSSLHHWAAVQRRKRQGIKPYTPLTSRQIQLLDQIHFSWNPEQDERDRQLAVWHAKYHVLVNFYNKHGHLKVKYGSSLYQWMVTQRQRRYGTGKQTPLSPEQVRLLNAIGFSWAPTGGPHEIAWYNKYQELAKCYQQHGDLRAAIKAPSSLYTWMVNQRQRRAGKGDFAPLNEEQIRLLDGIHFEWSPSEISGGGALGGARAIKWHQKYQELVDFYQQHGHFKVERPSSMYTWMSNQRTKRKNTILLRQTNKKIHAKGRMATLTNEQIQLLNEIGFPWEPRRKRALRE